MYDKIGKKLKRLAVVSFIVEAIGAAITGIIMLCTGDWWGLLVMLGGPIVAWVSSWILYGFGELIDKICDIERNTRSEIKSNTQKKCDEKNIDRIEKLRKNDLITEEEYRKKYREIISK